MSQTLGAFLSVMTVMLISMNFQAATISKYRTSISSELEVMASAVATETMEYISTKPFDARVADGTITPQNTMADSLTTFDSFGNGMGFAAAGDIDDFNNMVPRQVFFETEGGEGVTFVVSSAVSYVTADGATSSIPTWHKRVTVMVEGPEVNSVPYLIRPVVLTRQFSPQWY